MNLNILAKIYIAGKPESFRNESAVLLCTCSYVVQFELDKRQAKKHSSIGRKFRQSIQASNK